jgi:hypothetical protein
MPKKDRNEGIARSAGTGTDTREREQATACRRRKKHPRTDAIFANSIHSVRFAPKCGAEIMFTQGAHEVTHVYSYTLDAEKLYRDLLVSYTKAVELFCPGASLNIPDASLYIVLDRLVKHAHALAPPGFLVNIDYMNDNHFFTFYSNCNDSDNFNYLFIFPAVTKLARTNVRLHTLFLQFLQTFRHGLNIQGWWEFSDQAIHSIKEAIECNNEDHNEKIIKSFIKNINVYEQGLAYQYQQLIDIALTLTVDELLDDLKEHPQANPIVKIIKEGCELLQEGIKWTELDYIDQDYDDGIYLPAYMQTGIGWCNNDHVFKEFENHLNMDANDGIQQRIASLPITAQTTSNDIERLYRMKEFPGKVNSFFQHSDNLMYQYERPNRKTNR